MGFGRIIIVDTINASKLFKQEHKSFAKLLKTTFIVLCKVHTEKFKIPSQRPKLFEKVTF